MRLGGAGSTLGVNTMVTGRQTKHALHMSLFTDTRTHSPTGCSFKRVSLTLGVVQFQCIGMSPLGEQGPYLH